MKILILNYFFVFAKYENGIIKLNYKFNNILDEPWGRYHKKSPLYGL